jgi:hypothetical protein
MEIEDDLYPFCFGKSSLDLASEKVNILCDVCFVESLLTKSKVLMRQESLGKCLKVESRFYKRPIFERVALFAAESELRFSITYTTFISKYSWFCTCGEFVNARIQVLNLILVFFE